MIFSIGEHSFEEQFDSKKENEKTTDYFFIWARASESTLRSASYWTLGRSIKRVFY